MSTLIRQCLFIPLLAIVLGCATPYEPPLLDPAGAEFPGIQGLMSDSGSVDVLSIHGMCTHDKKWVDKTVDRIDENLPRLTATRPELIPVPGIDVYKTSFVDDGGNVLLRNYALVWSPLTDNGKKSLCYDSGITTLSCPNPNELSSRKRGSINNAVKSILLNDCLSDVVLYLGPDGERIRHAVRETVDKISGDAREGVPLVLISESLGSKILADSLLEKVDGKADRLAYLSSTQQVFMAANQLPLIELSDDAAKRGGNSAWAGLLEEILTVAADGSGWAQIVAFTDPNDLLSYELRDRTYSSANVIVSNARTWFGMLERPDTAHTGYLDNDSVWELIVCGHERDCEDDE